MNLLTKIMQFIHRILGTALSILFLVWFLSGLVMIYHTFPRADRADKRAKMDILSPENLPSLDQIEKRLPQNERISHVTLNSYLGQTVFHIRAGIQTCTRYSADEVRGRTRTKRTAFRALFVYNLS